MSSSLPSDTSITYGNLRITLSTSVGSIWYSNVVCIHDYQQLANVGKRLSGWPTNTGVAVSFRNDIVRRDKSTNPILVNTYDTQDVQL